MISTIAGNLQYGNVTEGMPAINAPLKGISCVQLNNAGSVYLNNTSDNTIKKIDPVSGAITTVAGNGTKGFSGDGGPALAAALNNPVAFVIDRQGNILICDTYNNRVRKIDAQTNIIHTIAGDGSNIYKDGNSAIQTGIAAPSCIDVDSLGNIYIGTSEYISHDRSGYDYILKVDAVTGIIKKLAGNGTYTYTGTGSNALQTGLSIAGLRVSAGGDIYFADPLHNCILKLDISTGKIITVAGSGALNIFGYKGDGGPAFEALLNAPVNLCFDADSNLLIVDQGSNVIRKINMQSGDISTVAGNGSPGYSGDGGMATCAELHIINGFTNTSGITAGKSSHDFYFCDQGNQCIRKVNDATIRSQDPSFSISTDSTNICPGQAVLLKGNISNNIRLAANQIRCQWYLNGSLLNGDSLIYQSSDLKNNDTVYCLLRTVNNVCKTVVIKSNALVFSTKPSLSFTVNITPVDTTVCPAQGVAFRLSPSVNNQAFQYLWKVNGNLTNNHDSSFTAWKPANGDKVQGFVSFTSADCQAPVKIGSAVATVSVKAAPDITLTPADTTIMPGAQVQLTAGISGNTSSYYWFPAEGLSNASILNPIASPEKTTQYYFVSVSQNLCRTEKSVIVKLSLPLMMPSAFTPNNDGKNDIFRIPTGIPLELNEFSIYHRWGKKIFSTKKVTEGWDGNYKNGAPAEQGTYIYIINGTIQNKPFSLTGTVVLLR